MKVRHALLAGIAAASFATGSPALLGIGCGSDRVFLNFSSTPVQVDGLTDWQDRLSEQPCGATLAVEPWGVVWAGPAACTAQPLPFSREGGSPGSQAVAAVAPRPPPPRGNGKGVFRDR